MAYAASNERWEEIERRARRAWGELPDEDFVQAEGSIDELFLVIARQVGGPEDDVMERIQDAYQG